MKFLRVQILLDEGGKHCASSVEADLADIGCGLLGQVYAQAVMIAAQGAAHIEAALRSGGEVQRADEFHRAYVKRLTDPQGAAVEHEKIEFHHPPEEE